jgi:ABC-type Mn2+/Zn2+ transport system permease subunit
LRSFIASDSQLVICAGAVFAARNGRLKLDAAIVMREVGFYALSIALLLYALQDKEPADDDQLGGDHIFISFTDAALLAFAYVLYVIVCANFNTIVDFWKNRRAPPKYRQTCKVRCHWFKECEGEFSDA